MRVISQNGTMDVPYETGSFNMICAELVEPKRTNIYCHHSSIGVAIKIAEYSTEAKAIKAMEMLRTVYESRMELDGGYDSVHKCYVQPNFWVLPKVFQFPQDDEIEV